MSKHQRKPKKNTLQPPPGTPPPDPSEIGCMYAGAANGKLVDVLMRITGSRDGPPWEKLH